MRRSLLFIPSNNPAMMQNASLFQADSIIFDLEDAVALKDKDSARILLNHFIKQEKLNCEMIVRINGLDTNDALKDLDSVVLNGVDTIMLPKADVASLRQLDSILTQYELTRHLSQPIKVIPIIELAMSLLDVRAIASSPRVDGLLLGAGFY
ncbi:MAG: aldolase/citrate lyase family protein [Bacilli bacterium]